MASKNILFVLLICSLAFVSLFSACNRTPAEHWSEFVPKSTFFVLVPDSGSTVEQVLANPYIPMLDDITPSVLQLVTTLQSHSPEPVIVEAFLLHPSSSTEWQPVWITKTVDNLPENLTSSFQQEYEQNHYEFRGHTIEKIFISSRIIYMVSFDEWTLFSESSIALESILRSLNGIEEALQLTRQQTLPGSIIMNTENINEWIQQLSEVMSRPFLENIFEGSSPVSFQQQEPQSDIIEWQLQGSMEIGDSTSNLVTYLTRPAEEFSLDRFIPANAAGFSIFRTDQQAMPDSEDFEARHEVDRYIENNTDAWHTIQQNLGSETAFVSFANSGPSSSSEYLFLRALNDTSAIHNVLDNLTEENLLIKDEQTYFANSYLLGKLFGSEIFPIEDFYITIYNGAAAIAQRKGLAESIGGDAERRRVMYYDDGYSAIRNSLPRPLSSIHYINAADFGTYIQPWLFPQNYLGRLIGNLDEFVITTRREADANSADISVTSFRQEIENYPYTEQWVFPLDGAEISGTPVLANITGSIRNEVIFSTTEGIVYALATDGTRILQASTMDDQPVGAPVVYDWYGNNQNIIMQAAGDKIYAWNQSGDPLPNFPVLLDENITTPLTVTDITGNGVAEMIVATADRNMHILNARGQAISGWPQSTNSVVRSEPLIAAINNQQSLFVFSENALHAWNINGQRRENYPVFLTAQMQGAPHQYNEYILGSGLDGNLYSVGASILFDASTADLISTDSLVIQALPVSNSSLSTSPSHHEILSRTDDGESFLRETFLLLQTRNGSVFLYDDSGELHFTASLGQPSSPNYPPDVIDINGDQRNDVVALADFGRLYAWDILSGERHNELPTSGMNYPVISDFLGNGKQEIIAQTRNGLQCWTINFTVRGSTAGN